MVSRSIPVLMWQEDLFCGGGGEEGVLELFLQTPIHSCQQGYKSIVCYTMSVPCLTAVAPLTHSAPSSLSLVFLMGKQPLTDTAELWDRSDRSKGGGAAVGS